MRAFCQNPYCNNPGAKVVPVSVEKPSDDGATWRVIEVYLEDHDDGEHWIVEADPPEDLACGGDMDQCAAARAQEGWIIDNQLET